ncbi:MAG TPA: nucleotidyltransferase domain-containing protein [Nitrososphaerales archaeon]|nr:nucleotidyltransferase domain-containing protein [Nitrososphaerales archaeon]
MRLSDDERTTLTSVASSLVEPSKITAVCAYGSKVAGYARKDSDYDLIIVLKRFREGVRYKYVDAPVAASALIVDEEMLRQDALSSHLGEFVVGRLLNVYEPVQNADLFRRVEFEYKKRVLVEALLELSSDYGDFGRHLVVPYEYFLFDKLHTRAAIYPPALYSYVHTYTCPLGEENKAISIGGFVSAADSLQSRGLLLAVQGGVKMAPEKLKADAFTRVQSMFSVTARGVTQYAIHGYAGRVGPSVFSREALSKLRRMRENPPPFAPLERPRSLLRLEEGAVIPDASLLVEELARLLGFERYSTKEKDIGEPYSTTRVLTFWDSARERSVVVKNYTDVRSLKWALLGVWASAANKFSTAPVSRMDREYGMSLKLRAVGVMVPSVVAVAPAERILVKDFVRGPTLSSVINALLKGAGDGIGPVSAYGEVMSKVHSCGIALGDAKPSNVVVSDKGLYLTDLEQSFPGGDQAWDVAEFLYYTAKLSVKEEAMKKVASAFLESYAKSGSRASISRARGQKYFGPFRPFLTPGMAKMLKELMSAYA